MLHGPPVDPLGLKSGRKPSGDKSIDAKLSLIEHPRAGSTRRSMSLARGCSRSVMASGYSGGERCRATHTSGSNLVPTLCVRQTRSHQSALLRAAITTRRSIGAAWQPVPLHSGPPQRRATTLDQLHEGECLGGRLKTRGTRAGSLDRCGHDRDCVVRCGGHSAQSWT